MARKNKFRYLWVIQGYYCSYGWEDLSEYDKSEFSLADVRHDLREYRIAGDAPVRLVSRREFNKDED